MRTGCLGCLGLLLVLLLSLVLVGGALLVSSYFFEVPSRSLPEFTAQEGYSAQQKIAEMLLREAGLSRKRGPIFITDRELNSFILHHLEPSRRFPLDPIWIRFLQGRIEVEGGTTVGGLLAGFPFSWFRGVLPQGIQARSLWVTAKGAATIEGGTIRVILREFSVGKQPLPPWLLKPLFGERATRVMEWKAPRVLERIEIVEGGVRLYTRRR